MDGIVLHVRNIPCKVLETELGDTMRMVGLDVSRYALFFPKKLGRQGRYNNYGYGFVTCSGTEDAEAFFQTMHGFRFQNINSNKRLIVESGYSNAAVERMDSVSGQPAAAWVEHSWCPIPGSTTSSSIDDHTWRSTSSSVALSSTMWRSSRMSEHNATLPAAHKGLLECLTVSGSEGPDASEVPQTRLDVPERSLAHFVADSADTSMNDSPRGFFCFQ
eukprot:TRINITY_DN10005_c1_g1_i2.p1 TRINITY_DN10005_c1_g1~~TRINITY_DN10005_c1_g1_i2.p1  ORF type:complete len:218 (-),score=7.47 TRINITY_DN10005_c1_g1_i2:188-841(-)